MDTNISVCNNKYYSRGYKNKCILRHCYTLVKCLNNLYKLMHLFIMLFPFMSDIFFTIIMLKLCYVCIIFINEKFNCIHILIIW